MDRFIEQADIASQILQTVKSQMLEQTSSEPYFAYINEQFRAMLQLMDRIEEEFAGELRINMSRTGIVGKGVAGMELRIQVNIEVVRKEPPSDVS